MAKVLENGHRTEWNITLRCPTCRCLYLAEWNDVQRNKYPLADAHRKAFYCSCPQCSADTAFDSDPRVHHSKVAEFIDDAIRNGSYR